MRLRFLSLILLMLTPLIFGAEEGKPAPERRKRPRFLIYDVKPVLIGKEGTTAAVQEDDTSEDVTKEALLGIRLPSQSGSGVPSTLAAPIITLPAHGNQEEQEEEENEEDAPWVTPLDFLSTEDLIAPEEGTETELEEEAPPDDWESLEKTLQEQQEVDQRSEEELREEAMQEMLEAPPQRTEVSSGLQLSSVLGDSNANTAVDPEGSVGSGSQDRTGLQNTPDALSAPLPPAMNLGGQPSSPDLPSSSYRTGLEGSRALFSEVRERWQPAAGGSDRDVTSPVTSPLDSSAVRSLGQIETGPSASPSSLPSFTRNDPAPMLRQERSFQPAGPDLSPSLRPPQPVETVREPRTRPTLEGFQRRDTGVRSRIGELPGMGRP